MSEILKIENGTVKVGMDDGTTIETPIATLQFSNPKVGDQVRPYKDGDSFIVKRVEHNNVALSSNDEDRRRVNKIAYVLLTFFVGALGVHRFMRGQIGLGILMLLFGWWATLGIWPLVDFIISLVKLSAYPGDDFIFTPDGRFTK